MSDFLDSSEVDELAPSSQGSFLQDFDNIGSDNLDLFNSDPLGLLNHDSDPLGLLHDDPLGLFNSHRPTPQPPNTPSQSDIPTQSSGPNTSTSTSVLTGPESHAKPHSGQAPLYPLPEAPEEVEAVAPWEDTEEWRAAAVQKAGRMERLRERLIEIQEEFDAGDRVVLPPPLRLEGFKGAGSGGKRRTGRVSGGKVIPVLPVLVAQVVVRYPNPDPKKALSHPYAEAKLNSALTRLHFGTLIFEDIAQKVYNCHPILRQYYVPLPDLRGGFQGYWDSLPKSRALTIQDEESWEVFKEAYHGAWKPLKEEFPRLFFIAGGEAASAWLDTTAAAEAGARLAKTKGTKAPQLADLSAAVTATAQISQQIKDRYFCVQHKRPCFVNTSSHHLAIGQMEAKRWAEAILADPPAATMAVPPEGPLFDFKRPYNKRTPLQDVSNGQVPLSTAASMFNVTLDSSLFDRVLAPHTQNRSRTSESPPTKRARLASPPTVDEDTFADFLSWAAQRFGGEFQAEKLCEIGAKPHIANVLSSKLYKQQLGWSAGNVAEYQQLAKVFMSRL